MAMGTLAAGTALAGGGIDAIGTLVGGGAQARAAIESSTASGISAIMSSIAEVSGLGDQIKILREDAGTKRLAGDVEAQALERQANEEAAQGSVNAQEAQRRKRLALSQLTANASASGFTSTDPTASAISDEIERYGTVQSRMELYGGFSRSDALKTAGAARRYGGISDQRASLLTANAARRAGLDTLRSTRYAARTGFRSGSQTASAIGTGSLFGAASSLAGGAAGFARYYK